MLYETSMTTRFYNDAICSPTAMSAKKMAMPMIILPNLVLTSLCWSLMKRKVSPLMPNETKAMILMIETISLESVTELFLNSCVSEISWSNWPYEQMGMLTRIRKSRKVSGFGIRRIFIGRILIADNFEFFMLFAS